MYACVRFSILLALLAGGSQILPNAEACNVASYFQCINSTFYLWCVEEGGSLVTIGDPYECPGDLVCDDSQAEGCVSADGVSSETSTTEDTTTSDETTTTVDDTTTTDDITSTTDDTTTTTDDTTTADDTTTSTDDVTSTTDDTTTTIDDTTTSIDDTTSATNDIATSSDDITTVDDTATDNDTTTVSGSDLYPVLTDADFVCIYEGLYKALDCSRYHVCYKIIFFLKHYYARCSEGLYWSSVTKTCVLQSLSDCP